MRYPPMTLATLQRGIRYVIASVDCADPVVQRLMVLGLVEGAEVELASSAIGGDPLEFRMFGNAISLRREHARYFTVRPVDSVG
jgi:Fe2+ transport system protein FeoA